MTPEERLIVAEKLVDIEVKLEQQAKILNRIARILEKLTNVTEKLTRSSPTS